MIFKLRKLIIFVLSGFFVLYFSFVIYICSTISIANLIEINIVRPTIVPPFLSEFIMFEFRCNRNDIIELKANDGGLNYVISALSDSGLSNEKKEKYIRFFISKGLGVNDVSAFDGFRPLHAAVIVGKADLVQMLLSNGADPLLRSKSSIGFKNMTPLEVTESMKKKNPQRDYSKVIEVLRKAEKTPS